MTKITPLAALLARILLAALFIVAGLGKLSDVAGFTAYMTSGGVPAFLAWPVIALEVLGGLAVLFGFQTRIAALMLAGFTVLAGVMFHFDPSDQMQMSALFKNLAVTGGLILLATHGAGTYSLDSRMGGAIRTT